MIATETSQPDVSVLRTVPPKRAKPIAVVHCWEATNKRARRKTRADFKDRGEKQNGLLSTPVIHEGGGEKKKAMKRGCWLGISSRKQDVGGIQIRLLITFLESQHSQTALVICFPPCPPKNKPLSPLRVHSRSKYRSSCNLA